MLLTRSVWLSALAIAALNSGSQTSAQEYDTCSCKVIQVGATSTLAGGTCTRTEADYCLMEWGSSSQSSTQVGDNSSQYDAIRRALDQLRSSDDSFLRNIQGSEDIPDDQMPFRIAEVSRRQPMDPGVPESFVLLAAAALTRFGAPVEELAPLVTNDYRLGEALGGSPMELVDFATTSSFTIRTAGGCLSVRYGGDAVRIVVKAPSGSDAICE